MWRSAAPRNRRAGIVLFLLASAIRAETTPATRVPPLPPPVSRATYRSNWFELLSALQENDSRTATASLETMMKAARAAGIRRLSSFSRAALHEARKAENAKARHASLAYDIAARLDDSNFDAAASRIGYLVRQGRLSDAASQVAPALATVFAVAETRLAFFSTLVLALAVTLAATAAAIVLGLFLAHFRRLWHDLREIAARPFGQRAAASLAVALLLLPVLVTLGPVWLLLYWGVIAYAYSDKAERWLLAGAEDPDGILRAVGGEDEIGLGDERARDARQPPDGEEVALLLDIDHVHRVVGGMSDVDLSGRLVHGGMIEAAGLGVRGKIDEAEVPERHVSSPARARRRAARHCPRCGRARPRSRRSPPAPPTDPRADHAPPPHRSRS